MQYATCVESVWIWLSNYSTVPTEAVTIKKLPTALSICNNADLGPKIGPPHPPHSSKTTTRSETFN
eukprot:2491718-Amphidinium_carterae.1